MREEVKSRKPTPKKKYSSDHGHREQGVLNDLIDYCPRFLDVPNDDWVSVSKGQDPPDLVGSGRIGLELTEWLNPNQTTEAMRRLRMRGDLLRLLNEQSLPAPQNYRLVFVRPRWVKPASAISHDVPAEGSLLALRPFGSAWVGVGHRAKFCRISDASEIHCVREIQSGWGEYSSTRFLVDKIRARRWDAKPIRRD